MARPLRINYPGAFYHVTSRGNERKPVFKSGRDREKFFDYLESATQRYLAVIHAFCLMDNHYHLLVETPGGNLPQIMRHINGAYTTYFNVKRDRCGHLFQGRYKAILVEKDAYAKELSRYIHLNPVRAKMVDTPEEYAWSSYRFYVKQDHAPTWLYRNYILGYFGGNHSMARKGYHHYVTSAIQSGSANPLEAVVSSTLLGTPVFIASIKDTFLARRHLDKSLPALKELVDGLSTEEVVDAVDTVFGQKGGLARQMKIHLCRMHTGQTLKAIGNHFGIGESAVCQASRRIKNMMNADSSFKRQIEQLEEKIISRHGRAKSG